MQEFRHRAREAPGYLRGADAGLLLRRAYPIEQDHRPVHLSLLPFGQHQGELVADPLDAARDVQRLKLTFQAGQTRQVNGRRHTRTRRDVGRQR